MTIRRAIVAGILTGIACFLLVTHSAKSFGLDMSRLRDFPAYAASVRTWRWIEAAALDKYRSLRRYLEDEDRERSAAEKLAVSSIDRIDEAFEYTEDAVNEWVTPVVESVAAAGKFVKSRLLP